ncbi:MAG TPA: ABC transporter ATP-binding protein [Rickettsiales bacterium]|nr:ABC transporter ATP-binding protein [Rickettsiales bacterium]
MQSPLDIRNLTKRYGSNLVLDNVSLSLSEGELFGLIGLNGVGKTTLIKNILDLTRPDSGEASIFGVPCANAQARRSISYLPEKFQPSRYLRGREYLELSLSYFGKPFDMEQARKEAMNVDLNPDALNNKVGSYSKGMGQKLGLIGAFLIDAPLLILDEPMSGLDPRARIMLKERLLASKKAGKTIFFSSHILSDIDEICDRIGVISNSKLIFVGTPQQFKQANKGETLEKSFLSAIAA